jgi:S1-C subfamily serine protease
MMNELTSNRSLLRLETHSGKVGIIDAVCILVSQNASKPLKPLVLGNSSEVGVGDTVIAIGNPFGLSDTMTTGIVSGIDRSVPMDGVLIPNAIQTDVPIGW